MHHGVLDGGVGLGLGGGVRDLGRYKAVEILGVARLAGGRQDEEEVGVRQAALASGTRSRRL